MNKDEIVETTMNRWIQTLSCLAAITMTSSLLGWGASQIQPKDDTLSLQSNFPMNDDQQWFVKETYLIMKPYQDDIDYASKLTTDGSTATSLSMAMKLEKPEFDWYSGVRLGVGRYLANHDKWDITLLSTYYYAEEKASSNPNRSSGTLLTPLWSPTFDGGATDGNVMWRLNFFDWDLSVGRQYNLLRTVVAHPFIGLRAALIYKNYKANYSDTNVSGNINRVLNDSFKANDTFWGIGPRAGVDLQFTFKGGWSFLGNLSGALFYGNYSVEERISTDVTSNGARVAHNYNITDERYCIRANLDTGLGIGWETWLKKHSVRLAPSVLFEASCWFDTNQFFLTRNTVTSTVLPSNVKPNLGNFRRDGNLILMGFSFNLQADF